MAEQFSKIDQRCNNTQIQKARQTQSGINTHTLTHTTSTHNNKTAEN